MHHTRSTNVDKHDDVCYCNVETQVDDPLTGDLVCTTCARVLATGVCEYTRRSYADQSGMLPITTSSLNAKKSKADVLKTHCDRAKRIMEDMDVSELHRVWFTAVEILKEVCGSTSDKHIGASDDSVAALAAAALQLAFHACGWPRSTHDMAAYAAVTMSSMEKETKRIHTRVGLCKLRKIMRV